MSRPTLAVVVCTYNAAGYLAECLDSLLAQTDQPDDILVVDGDSQDGSRELLERYGLHSEGRIRWRLQGPVRGLAEARNQGLAHTNSDVISFIDVDARARPDWVEVARRRFAGDPGLGGLGGQGVEVGTSPADRFRSAYYSQTWGSLPKKVPFLFGLNSHYRRPALQAIGGFDRRFLSSGEDVFAGLKLTQLGWRLEHDPELVVYHARRDDWASLKSMVYRWSYYGRLAKLSVGGELRSPLFWPVWLTYRVLRWAFSELPAHSLKLEGWWRRPLLLLEEARAAHRAQCDWKSSGS